MGTAALVEDRRMAPPRLNVLVVAGHDSDARFVQNVLEEHGDSVTIARDVPDALSKLSRNRFDVATVSLSLPRGDGLAFVHHVRALSPDVDVVVLAGATEIQETAHAMALGVLAHVMLPPTGDALLVAIDRARERRLLIAERSRLYEVEAATKRRSATYARCAAFVAETEIATVAERVLEACAGEIELSGGCVYAPAFGTSGMQRLATRGAGTEWPGQVDGTALSQVDPTSLFLIDKTRIRLLLMGHASLVGLVELEPKDPPLRLDSDIRESLQVIAAIATSAFIAARKVDAIARAGIKDPETSAYTFAYFGDVAGREIDRARRHGRRFSLITIALEEADAPSGGLFGEQAVHTRRCLADAILEAVRDSDVLARVEDNEFYLLLPETGLLGALSCRRRVIERILKHPDIQRLSPSGRVEPLLGIAVYPSDGADLATLLRASRRRGDLAREGMWRRHRLAERPFWDVVDTLVGTGQSIQVTSDGSLELSDSLRELQDSGLGARHAVMHEDAMRAVVQEVASQVTRQSVAGTVYVAGDPGLAEAVLSVMDQEETSAVRLWLLGKSTRVAGSDPHHLPLSDPRLERYLFFISLTELGGYMLAARPLSSDRLLVYHTSDLDLVDNLMAMLQQTYQLQPEMRA